MTWHGSKLVVTRRERRAKGGSGWEGHSKAGDCPGHSVDLYIEVDILSNNFVSKDNYGWGGWGIQSRSFKGVGHGASSCICTPLDVVTLTVALRWLSDTDVTRAITVTYSQCVLH